MIYANAHTTLTGQIVSEITVNPSGYGLFTLAVNLGSKFPWGKIQRYEIGFNSKFTRLVKYLAKGASVTCFCTPYNDSWDDKYTGEKRYKHKYHLEALHFNEIDLRPRDKRQPEDADIDPKS